MALELFLVISLIIYGVNSRPLVTKDGSPRDIHEDGAATIQEIDGSHGSTVENTANVQAEIAETSSSPSSENTEGDAEVGNSSRTKSRTMTRAAESGLPAFPTFAPLPQGLGLPSQGEGSNPTLFIGGFSLMKMPMPGMTDVMNNIMPFFQTLPTLPPFTAG